MIIPTVIEYHLESKSILRHINTEKLDDRIATMLLDVFNEKRENPVIMTGNDIDSLIKASLARTPQQYDKPQNLVHVIQHSRNTKDESL